ncbi:calponin homology domain-containing protein [Pelagophyceae sp. CCMP2097]|nr:calponin homology domain-containing protein [Pelagophyceae sp. CCMP2097]
MALEESVKKAMAAKLIELKPQMDEAIVWIEVVTEEKMEGTFDEWLRSGQVLCRLLNKIKPDSVKKVNAGAMPFKQMENLSMYTRGVKALGMHESDCFDTNDLFRGNDIGKVVQSIHAFGSLVRSKKLYDGPQLGVMHAQRNAREFTEAQIAQGRTATSKLTAGSSSTMEKTHAVMSGITVGHDHAGGSGSTNTATKLSQGSSVTMEKTSVVKSGITVGHEWANGPGSFAATKFGNGSADVMERTRASKPGITFGKDAGKP